MALICPDCGKRNPDGMKSCLGCSAALPVEKTEDEKTNDYIKIGLAAGLVVLIAVYVIPIINAPEKFTVNKVDTKCELPGFKDHQRYYDQGYERDRSTALQWVNTDRIGSMDNPPRRKTPRVCFTKVLSSSKPFAK